MTTEEIKQKTAKIFSEEVCGNFTDEVLGEEKAIDRIAALFSAEMEKKDAEILTLKALVSVLNTTNQELRFKSFQRAQEIDLLEKRVEELETMKSAFESINSVKNIHLDNRKAK